MQAFFRHWNGDVIVHSILITTGSHVVVKSHTTRPGPGNWGAYVGIAGWIDPTTGVLRDQPLILGNMSSADTWGLISEIEHVLEIDRRDPVPHWARTGSMASTVKW